MQVQAPLMEPPGDLSGRERMLRALRFQAVDRPPLWFMRQAGRYLPEYQAIRAGVTFEERLRDPTLAARITLQPLRRFPLDAAIVFSDILVPLMALGCGVRFGEGGPRFDDPVRTPEQVEALLGRPCAPMASAHETIRLVRAQAPWHAVLGFAGAPFTLASYAIEGGGSKDFAETKRFAYQHPDAWHALLERLADVVADHLLAQVDAGADAVQLFDTWAEALAPREYEELARPALERCIASFRARSQAPLVLFARGTSHLHPVLAGAGASALSGDWRCDLPTLRTLYPRLPLQGNLDPTVLFAPPLFVRRETRRILDGLHGDGHVFNLGHGILPGTPMAGVAAMVEEVVAWRP